MIATAHNKNSMERVPLTILSKDSLLEMRQKTVSLDRLTGRKQQLPPKNYQVKYWRLTDIELEFLTFLMKLNILLPL